MQPKQEICDAADLIAAALRGVEPLKSDHIVTVHVDTNTAPVLCDPVLTNQALMNIIHNAYIYTPPGTPIEISASTAENGNVEIAVRDHGPGLPRDNPRKVLEKFFRGNQKNTGGVGLGLSIATGFVQAQGGIIAASNHPQGGAVFAVQLPRGTDV